MNRFAIRRCVLVCLALVALATPMAARQQPASRPARDNDLLRRIFATAEFAPRRGPQPAWFENGASYVVVEPTTGEPRGEAVVRYDTATGRNREALITPQQLTPQGQTTPLAIDDLSWSADNRRALIFTNSRRAWRTNTYGDYYVLDRTAGTLKKIGGDAPAATLMYAAFSPDATKVAYVRRNNLYVEDIATGAVRRLTEDGGDLVINGAGDWVNEEELSIYDAFKWSPDSRRIAYWQFDLHGVGNFALTYYLAKTRDIVTSIPYPATGPYPVTMNIPYPLAGTTNSAVRVGVVDISGGPTTWTRLPGDPRENYVSVVQWLDAKSILIEQLNRLQNTLTLQVAQAESGAVREWWRDHDEAFLNTRATGLEDPRRVGSGDLLVTSEKDGWQRVYCISSDGRERLVTRGAMDVVSVAGIDEARGVIYFIASPDNATERYLYRAPLDGSADPTRVTPASWKGTNSYDVSPNGLYAFHGFSSFDDPGVREVVTLPDHKVLRVTEDNAALKKAVAQLVKPPVEYFKVDAGGGVTVDGYVMKPPDFDPSKRYPVLVNVYGEPAGQTVTNRWGGQLTLFHRYIASLGYLVASFDNSGTPAPRGRAWRKSIYGAVGVLSSEQQAQALRSFAKTRTFVDLDRVAVWGWSGGGTNTLNLMFRHPELYKVGMSVAPVPDQRLYDTIYQERYMGLPQPNREGYEKASAINYADRLAGDLLIVHGSGDDNVHYQGTELLVNRLIELGKQFDFMTYPDRTHAISEGSGTSLHLYRLLTRYLTDHLPAGPRPPATG